MKDVVEVVGELAQDAIVRDRTGDEFDAGIVRHVDRIRRQEVVDDRQPSRFLPEDQRTRFDPTKPAPPTTRMFRSSKLSLIAYRSVRSAAPAPAPSDGCRSP